MLSSPAKVRNLQLPVQPQQQVLRLDVAVDHVLGVAVLERLGQRGNVPMPERGQEQRALLGVRWLARLSRPEHPNQPIRRAHPLHPPARPAPQAPALHAPGPLVELARSAAHVAVRFSSKWPTRCSSLYSSPLAAYSRIKYTRVCRGARSEGGAQHRSQHSVEVSGGQQATSLPTSALHLFQPSGLGFAALLTGAHVLHTAHHPCCPTFPPRPSTATASTTAAPALSDKPHRRSSRTGAGCWGAADATGSQSPAAAGAPRWTAAAGS